MSANAAIEIKNLTKEYQLGTIGHGTLYRDLQSWWANVRGKEDPNSKVFTKAANSTTSGSFLALDDVSFDVKEGEVLGVIGRNGAGKSTLLKILSRITAPSRGEIRIRGRVASLLEVGTGFHAELTGRENVYLNGAILGMTKKEIKTRFDEIVEFSELEKFIDTPVKRYSSGMTVRLAFAVAAHLEPEILVIDEVLAVGDLAFRKKCLAKMQGISQNDSRTILFVSHDMGAIRALCTKGVLLDKGRVAFWGDIDTAVQMYSDINKNNVTKGGIFEHRPKHDTGLLSFSRITLKNRNGVITSTFKRSDSVRIEIDFDGQAPQGGFNVEWRLVSERGDSLAFGGSYAISNKTYHQRTRNVVCEIESLPLANGVYMFTFMVRVWQQEAWDYIENAAFIEVNNDLENETGFEYELRSCGPLYLNHTWA